MARPRRRAILELCLALGEPDPDALLARIRPSVLGEWLAYFSINPWGAERADLRTGILTASVVNALKARVNGREARPSDFMPYHKPPPRDPDELEKSLRFAFDVISKKQTK